jgi:hypothetical protein
LGRFEHTLACRNQRFHCQLAADLKRSLLGWLAVQPISDHAERPSLPRKSLADEFIRELPNFALFGDRVDFQDCRPQGVTEKLLGSPEADWVALRAGADTSAGATRPAATYCSSAASS